MKTNRLHYLLTVTTLSCAILGLWQSCLPPVASEAPTPENAPTTREEENNIVSVDRTNYMTDDDQRTVASDVVPDEAPEPPKAAPRETTSKPATPASTGATPSAGGRRSIYVSTYGANGEVWGHVTLNGNTGSGNIHDANENTLSIRVTRHGNELFGTDQNGRQYVFKLK